MIFKNLFNSLQEWEQPLFGTFSQNTASGESVYGKNALDVGAVYAAVTVKANAVAKLPLQVFRKTESGRERDKSHIATQLLEKRPNPYQTPFVFKYTLTVHRNLWGKAYVHMVFNQKGKLQALNLLEPSKVQEVIDDNDDLWFIYSDKGVIKKLHHTEVIYLPYGPGGKSPIEVARETAGTMKAATKFMGGFYKNGTTAKGALKIPGQLDKSAKRKVREAWSEMNSGMENANSIAILDAGMEWVDMSMPLKDAEFIASQKFNISEIARIFNVPLHKLAEMDRATFSNIEQQSMEFIGDTIQPELVSIEEEINYKLFTTSEQKRYYVKFNTNSAMRADSAGRATYYREMLSTGAYSINQVLDLEDMDGIGVHGDGHRVDLNHISIEIADEYQLSKAKSGLKGGGKDEEQVHANKESN